jgi:flavin reductase (DIM6/NTAB) family NADH-FMN oxidoreductase RutF
VERARTPANEGLPIEVDNAEIETERLRKDVRLLMRNIPSSVAVITVVSYDPELKMNVPMGVAVSSLSTVTLDPPMVSFNIKHPSKTLDAIRAAGGLFRVHFPAADRGGAAMVDLFSRGNHPDAYNMRVKELKLYVPGHGSRADKLRSTPSKAPQILNDSVRAAMECTLTQELSVADHVILVARVESMETKRPGDRTILYVDGSYMRPDGTQVTMLKSTVTNPSSSWSIWDYRLFPGETERREYVQHIKSIVKEHTKMLQSGKEVIRELEANLPISPGVWGINLEPLIDECRREAGMASSLPKYLQDQPILSEFYGRITPSERAKIVERAKKLVAMDPRCLALNLRVLLQHLGVSTASIDLLPSDIAEPLRADGLLDPFVPRTQDFSVNRRDYTLQYLEQVEHRLVEHFVVLGHEKAVVTQLDQAMDSLGEQKQVATYFKKSRARMYASASPNLFNTSNIDISGEVSPEESRVIMSRVVRYMQVENPMNSRRNINADYHETLRFLGIHPSITAFDAEFFFGKIKHIYRTSRQVRDTVSRIEEMMEPWFATTIAWDDLATRVRSFVQNSPTRAMSWSTRDKLAAMGLTWEAVLDVPTPAWKQSLNSGHVLDTLVAKELKALYGKGAEELSQAIATFLKQEYNFDVDPQAAASSVPTQSSKGQTNEAVEPIEVRDAKSSERSKKRGQRFLKMQEKKAAAKANRREEQEEEVS